MLTVEDSTGLELGFAPAPRIATVYSPLGTAS
jgi:hypothetical protein